MAIRLGQFLTSTTTGGRYCFGYVEDIVDAEHDNNRAFPVACSTSSRTNETKQNQFGIACDSDGGGSWIGAPKRPQQPSYLWTTVGSRRRRSSTQTASVSTDYTSMSATWMKRGETRRDEEGSLRSKSRFRQKVRFSLGIPAGTTTLACCLGILSSSVCRARRSAREVHGRAATQKQRPRLYSEADAR